MITLTNVGLVQGIIFAGVDLLLVLLLELLGELGLLGDLLGKLAGLGL